MWFCVSLLYVFPVLGQHPGGVAGPIRQGGNAGTFAQHHSGSRGFIQNVFVRRRPWGGFNPYFGVPSFGDPYAYAYPLSDSGYGYGYTPAPNIVIAPAAPPVIFPPDVAHPVIHTYTQSVPVAKPLTPAAEGEQKTFTLALQDGSRLSTTMVWVQDGNVNYIDTDDRHRQVELNSVDRQATRKLNAVRGLDLRLPAP